MYNLYSLCSDIMKCVLHIGIIYYFYFMFSYVSDQNISRHTNIILSAVIC